MATPRILNNQDKHLLKVIKHKTLDLIWIWRK